MTGFDFCMRFEIRNSFGPEAHQDEFSTFNRGVVGSTPTRPTRLIANFELRIANLGRIGEGGS